MRNRVSGFSMTEIMVVIALVMGGTGVAMVQMRPAIAMMDADRAADMVVSQVRFGRQTAIDQRRNVRVDFIVPNRIQVSRLNEDSVATVISDVTLPDSYSFDVPEDVEDTPQAYGRVSPVYFNGAAGGTFLGDGVFVDATDVVLNGTVFLRGPSETSLRAVTLTGASGRTKIYRFEGESWVER